MRASEKVNFNFLGLIYASLMSRRKVYKETPQITCPIRQRNMSMKLFTAPPVSYMSFMCTATDHTHQNKYSYYFFHYSPQTQHTT